MNTLLGGSFTSRLNDNLREQHGYTYGARSSSTAASRRPLPGARPTSRPTGTGAAMTRVPEGARPDPDARHAARRSERARSYAALGYAAEFETTSQLAAALADKIVYDLPDDFFETFVPKALAVDAGGAPEGRAGDVDPERWPSSSWATARRSRRRSRP